MLGLIANSTRYLQYGLADYPRVDHAVAILAICPFIFHFRYVFEIFFLGNQTPNVGEIL